MDSLLVLLQANHLCGLMLTLVTAVAHLLVNALNVLLKIGLISCNEVTQIAGVTDPLVDIPNVLVHTIRKVCDIGAL